MNRSLRKWIITSLTAVGLVSQPLSAYTQKAIQQGAKKTTPEFTIVERMPPEKIASLEQLLHPPNEPPVVYGDWVRLRADRWPEILWLIEVEKSVSGKLMPRIKSEATAFILNKEGFFLSAYHNIFESYREQNHGRSPTLILLYDPESGIAAQARPLIISERDDILLGIMSTPNPQEKITYLAPSNVPDFNMGYFVGYHKSPELMEKLFQEVMQQGRCYLQGNKPVYEQRQRLPKKLQQLGAKMEISNLEMPAEIAFFLSTLKQKVDDIIIHSSAIPGDSGTPVFDANSRLLGIVKQRAEIPAGIAGKDYVLGVCTSTISLRKMIQTYVNAQKQK